MIMQDGYKTTIEFANASSGAFLGVNLEEQSVAPPGVEGGDPIETTSMRNATWKTKAPQSLKELLNSSFTASYDPAAYSDINDQVNVNQEITITFPDDSTLIFQGYLKNAVPNDHNQGEQPTMECEVVPTNMDDSGNETAPSGTVLS